MSLRWRERLALLSGLGLWGYTIAHYVHGAFGYRGYGDFFLLMKTVREWLATGHFVSQYVYLYPPLFYLISAPLAFLSDPIAVQVMVAINQVLLVICMALLMVAIAPKSTWRLWGWMLLPLALNFRPLLLLLSMAKIELLQLTVLLGALVAFQRKRPWVTGLLVAVAGLIKPLPLLWVLYFAWKREWRVVRAWGVAVAALLALSSFAVGVEAVWIYFSNVVLPRGENVMYWYEDQSLMGVVVRLFHPVQANAFYIPSDQVSVWSLALGWGVRLVVCGWLAVLLGRRHEPSPSRVWGEWSVVSAGMLLLSPFSRDYYAVFLLPGYLLLATTLWNQRVGLKSKGFWLGLASYLLVGQGFPLGIIRKLPPLIPGVDNFHSYLHYGIPTLGYLLLIAAWAVVLGAEKSAGRAERHGAESVMAREVALAP